MASGCIGGGPQNGSMPCDSDIVDLWRVQVKKAGSYTFNVDTRNDDATFDPYLVVYEVDTWSDTPSAIELGDFVDEGDDDFDCTYPPPDYSCPSATESVPEGDLLLAVGAYTCVGTEADYRVEVLRDGDKKVSLEYVGSADIFDLGE